MKLSVRIACITSVYLAKRGDQRDKRENSLPALGFKITLRTVLKNSDLRINSHHKVDFSSLKCNLRLVLYGKLMLFVFGQTNTCMLYSVCCFCDC